MLPDHTFQDRAWPVVGELVGRAPADERRSWARPPPPPPPARPRGQGGGLPLSDAARQGGQRMSPLSRGPEIDTIFLGPEWTPSGSRSGPAPHWRVWWTAGAGAGGLSGLQYQRAEQYSLGRPLASRRTRASVYRPAPRSVGVERSDTRAGRGPPARTVRDGLPCVMKETANNSIASRVPYLSSRTVCDGLPEGPRRRRRAQCKRTPFALDSDASGRDSDARRRLARQV